MQLVGKRLMVTFRPILVGDSLMRASLLSSIWMHMPGESPMRAIQKPIQ